MRNSENINSAAVKSMARKFHDIYYARRANARKRGHATTGHDWLQCAVYMGAKINMRIDPDEINGQTAYLVDFSDGSRLWISHDYILSPVGMRKAKGQVFGMKRKTEDTEAHLFTLMQNTGKYLTENILLNHPGFVVEDRENEWIYIFADKSKVILVKKSGRAIEVGADNAPLAEAPSMGMLSPNKELSVEEKAKELNERDVDIW